MHRCRFVTVTQQREEDKLKIKPWMAFSQTFFAPLAHKLTIMAVYRAQVNPLSLSLLLWFCPSRWSIEFTFQEPKPIHITIPFNSTVSLRVTAKA